MSRVPTDCSRPFKASISPHSTSFAFHKPSQKTPPHPSAIRLSLSDTSESSEVSSKNLLLVERELVEDGVLESEQVREAHEDGTEHVVAPRDLEERIDELKEEGDSREFSLASPLTSLELLVVLPEVLDTGKIAIREEERQI
jgi:hypothetical protein